MNKLELRWSAALRRGSIGRGACRVAASLLALACLAAAPEPSSNAVLLGSTAPGYAPGMVLAAKDRLVVPDGATVTLLFRSGEMLRVRGPFEGAMEGLRRGDSSGAAAGGSEGFRLQGVDASAIGGVRAARGGAADSAAEEVLVDPDHSASFCLLPSTTVWIARPADPRRPYELRRGGRYRALAWPAPASRIEWPADVPIEDGDEFTFAVAGAPHGRITFRMLDPDARSDSARIAEGLLQGCRDQYEPMLRRLARSAGPPDLWLTTDRGRSPTYRPGEPIRLTVQPGTDGELFCVSVAPDGRLLPLFPAGAAGGAHVRGATGLQIPGDRQGMGLLAGGRGTQQVRCWLAERDVGAELPRNLVQAGSDLTGQTAADLDAAFDRAGAGMTARAVLDIHVE